MSKTWEPLWEGVKLSPSEFTVKRDRDLDYLMELKTENLLFAHYAEAGLNGSLNYTVKAHGGWDSPTSQIRGTFAGHWLSAAARAVAETGNRQLKARADFVVDEIGRCQERNGNGWAFPIPEKYLTSLRDGKSFWAPQYVCHKNMMGLLDMYLFAGNVRALEIVKGCADWFDRFSREISRETMSDMMDLQETGGMMELWADLYAVTGDPRHLELMRRYERPRLTEPVLRGEDVLTNRHANTTIPEIHGCARAYEVTGEERYRQIVERYWELAVTKRGAFVTGGQTSGEVWTPMGVQSSRLGDTNQEHCVVYNLIRLADYLFRWTGEAVYADYIEKNLYNGLLAQGFWRSRTRDTFCEPSEPQEGIVTYYLPLGPGTHKKWGSKTGDFWCCHCTAVQANVRYREWIYYRQGDALCVAQYIPSDLQTVIAGETVTIEQREAPVGESRLRLGETELPLDVTPRFWARRFRMSGKGKNFTLRLRAPAWLRGDARCWINGEEQAVRPENGWISLSRRWNEDEIDLILPKGIACYPLPDLPDTVAFLDGPVALAGLVDRSRTLNGDREHPETLIRLQDEREWGDWYARYTTVGQPENFSLMPLKDIGRETYTVYFPLKPENP